MALMAFGLSKAFRPRSSDRAGSQLWLSGGFRMAFELLSMTSRFLCRRCRPHICRTRYYYDICYTAVLKVWYLVFVYIKIISVIKGCLGE